MEAITRLWEEVSLATSAATSRRTSAAMALPSMICAIAEPDFLSLSLAFGFSRVAFYLFICWEAQAHARLSFSFRYVLVWISDIYRVFDLMSMDM
jgi:hypothetical protein